MKPFFFALCLGLSLGAAGPTRAQNTGTLAGQITAAAGGSLPAIRLELRGTPFETVPDTAGRFAFHGIQAGTYWLEVTVDRLVHAEVVHIHPQQVTGLDVVLPEAPHLPPTLRPHRFAGAPLALTAEALPTRPVRDWRYLAVYGPGSFSVEGDPSAYYSTTTFVPTHHPWFVRGGLGPPTVYLDGLPLGMPARLLPSALAQAQVDLAPVQPAYNTPTGIVHLTSLAFTPTPNGWSVTGEGLTGVDGRGDRSFGVAGRLPFPGQRGQAFVTGVYERTDDFDPRFSERSIDRFPQAQERAALYGMAFWRPRSLQGALTADVGGQYFWQERTRMELVLSPTAVGGTQQEQTHYWQAHARVRWSFGQAPNRAGVPQASRSLALQVVHRDQVVVQYSPVLSPAVTDLLRYRGTGQPPPFSRARQTTREGHLRLGWPLARGHLQVGLELAEQTRRAFRIQAPAELAGALPPDVDLEAAYRALPFEAVAPVAYWYGYNYLGTRRVETQQVDHITNGAAPEQAPFKPLWLNGYGNLTLGWAPPTVPWRATLELGFRAEWLRHNAPVLRDPFALLPIERTANANTLPPNVEAGFAVYRDRNRVVQAYRDLENNFFDANGNRVAADEGRRLGIPTVLTDPATGQPWTRITKAVFREGRPSHFKVLPRLRLRMQWGAWQVTTAYAEYAQYALDLMYETVYGYQQVFEQRASEFSTVLLKNPRLKPEHHQDVSLTGRYEIGPGLAAELAVFGRRIVDQVTIQSRRAFPYFYLTYANETGDSSGFLFGGFDASSSNDALVRGATVAFAWDQPASGMTARVSYTYLNALARDFLALSVVERWLSYEPERDLFAEQPLPYSNSLQDYDVPHQIKAWLDATLHRDTRLGLYVRVASGLAYTPFSRLRLRPRNSQRLPPTARLDVQLSHTLDLPARGTLTFFGIAQNLLARQNQFSPYPLDDRGDPVVLAEESLLESVRYGRPRQLHLGLRIEF